MEMEERTVRDQTTPRSRESGAGTVKRVVVILVVLVVAAAGYAVRWTVLTAPVGAGVTAKVLCSSVFVSGRDPADVLATDLEGTQQSTISTDVDLDAKTATASLFGLFTHTAVYREGLGCTLAIGISVEQLRREAAGFDWAVPQLPADLPWPEGELVDPPSDIDVAALEAALDDAFAEPDPERPRRTRAVVVVHRGRIVAERYAPGFTKDTPLVGWSMTKSVTNALVGILVGEDRLELHSRAPVLEWSTPGDLRHDITLDQLMRMSSGLFFEEIYDEKPNSDVNRMLFVLPDAGTFAAAKPLQVPPDTRWEYSSGTTNIISRIVREAVGEEAYWSFPRRALFDRIGMASAVLEPDPSGTFVGSSFSYATARDWARFGLLYLNDGVWTGERILPEGWVEYSVTPTPTNSSGQAYGAQIWLNAESPPGSGRRWLSFLPEDAYACRGYAGQFVVVIPSRNLVVVRLGQARGSSANSQVAFIEPVLEAIPPNA
jgi:CubicO group peptidase (beta-lactamase class C family)